METDQRLPSGEWNGFYIENHVDKRGWMHLYMTFQDGEIKGEGTDYVGPWLATGNYELETGKCQWTKQYLRKHKVIYSGQISENGIQGNWDLSFLKGPFHIWPKGMGFLNELYLKNELGEPTPTILEPNIPELVNS